jgi:hypothetical protein
VIIVDYHKVVGFVNTLSKEKEKSNKKEKETNPNF